MNMKDILLVEDDEDKRKQLVEFINLKIHSNVTEARSFQSGLKAIKSKSFDLILLDMTMPTFNINPPKEGGGRSQPFGGEMLLAEMVRRGVVTPVIVVTQFDLFGKGDEEVTLTDLDARLQEQFPKNYLGAVPYRISLTSWEDALLKKINDLDNIK
jgi:CheY-like chemotaxis protein